MKIIVNFAILFFCSNYMFSQYISVTDNQNAQALVDLLMSDACGVNVTNPKLVTGTDFGINGIGVFTEDTGDFPLKKGVLLTSGRATDCVGPKKEDPMLAGDGTDWKGDADLTKAISWVDKTFDASYLEFDFTTPASAISFNYVFASEEYGQIQCRRSDPVAFLLTDTETGITVNLALVPNTGVEVSTMSINNDKFSFDPECNSTNPEYFSRFFKSKVSLGLGENPTNSPTNFGGYTKKLTASYTKLIPNRNYHLKLVIADNADLFDGDKQVQLDSGVFLEAGSFNFGIELKDVTISSDNAVCLGEEVVFDTKIPNTINHIWFKDGKEIVGETQSRLIVTQPGTYLVKVGVEEDCFLEDSVVVEFKPTGKVEAVKNITYCKNTFNLTLNTVLALGNQPADAFNVSYFETQEAANLGTPKIATPNSYVGTNGQTVFVRVESKTNTECFGTASFKLFVKEADASFTMKAGCDAAMVDVEPKISGGQYSFVTTPQDGAQINNVTGAITNAVSGTTYNVKYSVDGECSASAVYKVTIFEKPIITTPKPLEVCDNSPIDGFTAFNLISKNEEIIGDKTTYTVSYHKTEADANSGANPLTSPYINETKNTQTVYVLVTDTETNCTIITPLLLKVFKDESATLKIQPTCKGALVVNKFPEGGVFSFNPVPNDGAKINATTGEITNGVTAAVYTINYLVTGECETQVSETIVIPDGPQINTPENDLLECDGLNNDGVAVFDLTTVIPEIIDGNTALTIAFFETDNDAKKGINAIKTPENYTIKPNGSTTQTIYVAAKEGEDCESFTKFNIRVIASPSKGSPITLQECDINNNGKAVFNLTENEANIIGGQSNIKLSYYTTFKDAESGVNSIKKPDQYNNSSNPETIYVRVAYAGNTDGGKLGCFSISTFSIKVKALPSLSKSILDIVECAENGVFNFDLAQKTQEILNTTDAKNDYNISYHSTQQDADNGVNPLPLLYSNTTNPETVFVRIESKSSKCANTTHSFQLIVNEKPILKNKTPLLIEECDNAITLDKNPKNDVTTFNIAGITATVLEGLDPQKYDVSYYVTESDAESGSNAIKNTSSFKNSVNPQTIYVRLTIKNSAKICYDLTTLTLKVNPLPPVIIDERYIICKNLDGTISDAKNTIINTGLSPATYSFEWINSQGEIIGTESSLKPTTQGDYTLNVIAKKTGCKVAVKTRVEVSSPPVVTATVVGEVASDGQSIVVKATGLGTVSSYEFKLDDGLWKRSASNTYTFNNVSAGVHFIFVKDVNGCGNAQTKVTVIGYPAFFTPNNDGVNDTWEIIGLGNSIKNKVYIFDRYGKLVNSINGLENQGWDGRFKGQLLPATDYWFLAEYYDKASNSLKYFRGHFALRL